MTVQPSHTHHQGLVELAVIVQVMLESPCAIMSCSLEPSTALSAVAEGEVLSVELWKAGLPRAYSDQSAEKQSRGALTACHVS